MTMQEKPSRQSKLSVVSALKFFLKGNLLFALTGITIYLFDIPTRIFPSLLAFSHRCFSRFIPTISSLTKTQSGLPH